MGGWSARSGNSFDSDSSQRRTKKRHGSRSRFPNADEEILPEIHRYNVDDPEFIYELLEYIYRLLSY